jgi:phospholipid/cholesterol/gamma-HCH transport system ATP-binding protein
MSTQAEIILEVTDLKIFLGGAWIHKGVNLQVRRGEILAIVGGSGTGKSVLLREILQLQQATSGSVKVFGQALEALTLDQFTALQQRWGVMFQQNALFSSLTVLQNTAFPLHEHTTLDEKTIQELALLKILSAGLPIEAAHKYPNELSGGMEKRAALARAIVLDPELLFLDEPTAGLDPLAAAALDELVLNLKNLLGLTIVMVTHDLDSLWRVADRVAFLGEGRVLAVEPLTELIANKHPLIQEYFSGARGRAVKEIYGTER